jgi:hypothetical protein
LELKTLPLCLGLELKEAAYCYINAFIVSLSDLLLNIYLNILYNHLYFFVPMHGSTLFSLDSWGLDPVIPLVYALGEVTLLTKLNSSSG